MTRTYQLVPYLFHVHVRGRPNETRPLNDLDGSGANVLDAVLRIFDGMGTREFVALTNEERKLRLVRVSTGQRCAYVELKPGRSGIASDIEAPPNRDGTPGRATARSRRHTEYVPVRHVFHVPPGGHHGMLLAERAGPTGAVGFLTEMLTKNFAACYPDLLLRVAPAATGEVLKNLTKDSPVKALVFTRPSPVDHTGKAMMFAGERVGVEVRVRTPKRRKWGMKALGGADGEVTRENLLGALSLAMGQGGTAADVRQLADEGWSAATEVKMPSGATRKVDVQASSAITMSFPIEETNPSEDRPSDDDFRRACQQTLDDLSGESGLAWRPGDELTWEDGAWMRPEGEAAWRVVWHESRSPEPGTP